MEEKYHTFSVYWLFLTLTPRLTSVGCGLLSVHNAYLRDAICIVLMRYQLMLPAMFDEASADATCIVLMRYQLMLPALF